MTTRHAVSTVVAMGLLVATGASACVSGSSSGDGAAKPEPGRTVRAVRSVRTAAQRFVLEDLVEGESGLGADDFAAAYDIATTQQVDATIAILAGGYNPSLESDLAVYRAHYQLPACTVASGCLRIVDSRGGTSFPAPRYDDIPESSLQAQVASAGCPSCKLLVVVAGSDPAFTPSLMELAEAAKEAVALGATVMTTAYGAPEIDENGDPWSLPYEKTFSAWASVPLFAASGDDGYLDGSSPDRAARVPAAFPEVFAVGGTTITPVPASTSARHWTEAASPTASSGCSVVFAKPAGQVDSACPKRTLNDLSATSDPALVYFTTVDPANGDQPGWHTAGGTGESAALVASIFAVTGVAYGRAPSFVYQRPAYYSDIISGSNGTCDAWPTLCNAQPGYDAPTGMGSPYGDFSTIDWITLIPASGVVPRGSSSDIFIVTNDFWAQKCTTLSFGFSGLPPGVGGAFLLEKDFLGNPQTNLALGASLEAPLTIGARA